MNERDMEDLIAEYPEEFFPHKRFELKGRQQSFAHVGRFDLLFEDQFKTKILMELKAVTAKYEVATQLAKYKDELNARGEKHLIMWLVPHRFHLLCASSWIGLALNIAKSISASSDA